MRIAPGDNSETPTIRYTYGDEFIDPATGEPLVPGRLKTETKEPGGYLDKYTYYDALGRVIQEKVETVNGWNTTDFYYDINGNRHKSLTPYLTADCAFSPPATNGNAFVSLPLRVAKLTCKSELLNETPTYQTEIAITPVPGVSGYRFYRRKNDGSAECLTPSGVTATTFGDSNLTAHDGLYEYGYSTFNGGWETEIKWGDDQTIAAPVNFTPKVFVPDLKPCPIVKGPHSVVVYTDVIFNLQNAKDHDNDQLEYRLYLRDKGATDWTLYRTVIPTADHQIITITLEDKKNYEWYLSCIETDLYIIDNDRQEVIVVPDSSLYIDTHYPLPLCTNTYQTDEYDNLWGTKGQPLQFRVEFNPIANFQTFEWNFGDGTPTQSGQQAVHIYNRLSDPAQPFEVVVTATDDQGIQYKGYTKVKIVNTPKGQLYADENWSGTHLIEGDIEVPEGIVLTVEPSTQIQVASGCTLTINGSLQIGSGAIFDSNTGSLWKGIRFNGAGAGNVSGATIKHAVRGISCAGSGQVAIENSMFEHNHTGLHCYNGNITVAGCAFQSNVIYGVKEDNNCNPVVSACIFQNNGINYYDYTNYKITVEKLNAAPNTGNEYR